MDEKTDNTNPSPIAAKTPAVDECNAALRAAPAGQLDADIALVAAEVKNARANWPAFNSAHEGYAVLLEEVDELWDHIKTNQKRRDLPAMRKEAMQVAAMALRFMGDCCDETTGRK